jgi:hypothetical protein
VAVQRPGSCRAVGGLVSRRVHIAPPTKDVGIAGLAGADKARLALLRGAVGAVDVAGLGQAWVCGRGGARVRAERRGQMSVAGCLASPARWTSSPEAQQPAALTHSARLPLAAGDVEGLEQRRVAGRARAGRAAGGGAALRKQVEAVGRRRRAALPGGGDGKGDAGALMWGRVRVEGARVRRGQATEVSRRARGGGRATAWRPAACSLAHARLPACPPALPPQLVPCPAHSPPGGTSP